MVCALGGGAESAVAQVGDSYTIPHDASLSISPQPTRGWVSGGGINCGVEGRSACSQAMPWEQLCTTINRVTRCDPPGPDPVTLTAAGGGTGWEPVWEGCDQVPAVDQCSKVVEQVGETVKLTWKDVATPSASFVSPPSRGRLPTTFTVSASDDQSGVAAVWFYVNGVFQARYDNTPPYTISTADISPAPEHGDTIRLRAFSRDVAGNYSAVTPEHTFTVDTTAALNGISMTPTLLRCDNPFVDPPNCDQRHVKEIPVFTFVKASDTVALGCYTKDIGGQVPVVEDIQDAFNSSTCTPAIPPNDEPARAAGIYDGAYRTHVYTHDGLNSTDYYYEYTLDRRGPTINLFNPQEGSYVTAPFTLNISGSDLSPPYVYRCDLGSGFGTCAGTHDPPEGAKTLRIESEDAIGNKRTHERRFTYDKTAPRVQITEGPAEGAFTDSGSVRFGFTASDAVGPLTTTCRVDQGEFGACTGAGSHSLENLNPGIHRFALRVVDAAGHATVVERLFVVPQPSNSNTTIINNNTTTTTTAPGGAVGGVVGGQVETTPGPLAAASARASRKFSVRGGRTTIKRLVLTELADGATVEVRCKGRGCFRGTKKYAAKSPKLDLTKLFKKRKLAARSVIELRISQPGRATRVYRYTTQKGRKQPKAEALTA